MSTEVKIDLEEIKVKLYEKLKPSGWGDKMKTFIMSSDFDLILKQLMKEVNEGNRFTPVLKQVFRAFEECPYEKLKLVWLLQDPYNYAPLIPGGLPVADGIPMSSSNDGKIRKSLEYVFKEIKGTVYPGQDYLEDVDLKRWSNQGILMLNCALTTQIGKTGTHYQIWQPFLAFLFDILAFNNPGLVYIFSGQKAQEWATSVPGNNWILFTSHPASAAYQSLEFWDSNNVFVKSQKLVYDQFKYNIIW